MIRLGLVDECRHTSAGRFRPPLAIAPAVLVVSVLPDCPGAWPYRVHAAIPYFSKALTTSPRLEFRKIG
jgi:hypothetical protein